MSENPSAKLPAKVEKIIKSPFPSIPEKAEIGVEGADDLYREIRIENSLTDENGNEVRLKEGAKVEVTVEAKPEETIVPKEKKNPHPPKPPMVGGFRLTALVEWASTSSPTVPALFVSGEALVVRGMRGPSSVYPRSASSEARAFVVGREFPALEGNAFRNVLVVHAEIITPGEAHYERNVGRWQAGCSISSCQRSQKWIGGSQAQFFFWVFPSLASSPTYFGRATPLLRDEDMKRIMGRLFSLFFWRATRAEVISFPRPSRFPRWQGVMNLGQKG